VQPHGCTPQHFQKTSTHSRFCQQQQRGQGMKHSSFCLKWMALPFQELGFGSQAYWRQVPLLPWENVHQKLQEQRGRQELETKHERSLLPFFMERSWRLGSPFAPINVKGNSWPTNKQLGSLTLCLSLSLSLKQKQKHSF
jgi:hypothetical protein